jgi:CRISPR/Cas system CMR subunit Cmr4 (Cas7 group RAMP superfamily)
MLGEIPYMVVWGFFSAMGWMTASYTVDKIKAEKQTKEEQVCTAWKEEILPDGTINRSRTCEIKTSP